MGHGGERTRPVDSTAATHEDGSVTPAVQAPSLIRNPAQAVGLALLVAYAVFVFIEAPTLEDFLQFTIIGIAVGAAYAISAAGLVLTYTTTGVFNFAHGAVGMIAAYLYYQVRVEMGWPTPIAMVVVIGLAGPVIGLGLELVMRSFRNSPPATTLTVTIAFTILLIGLAQTFFPRDKPRVVPSFFGDDKLVEIIGVRLRWDQIMVMVIAGAVAVILRYLLYVARTGVAMRAVVDNAELAGLNGTNPNVIARYAWVLGSTLAALAGVLVAPQLGALEAALVAFAVITAFGAAVVGKLASLPMAFAGALALGILQNWTSGIVLNNPDSIIGDNFLTIVPWSAISNALPGILLLAALLFMPEQKLTVGRIVGRDEPRVPRLANSLLAGLAFVGVVSVVAALMPAAYVPDTARAMVYATLLLSLVLLTGYSGQISLAQFVFLGLGAWAMGTVGGGNSLLGLVAAALVAVPLGALIALPALRLQGLYLALSTFAIAVVSRSLIFENDHVYGVSNQVVGRLKVLGLDFSGNRMFIVLCGAIFALVGAGVLAVRRSRFGRRLSAMRDSPIACATLGLDVRSTKLIVFCGSAAIAGLAGGLFGGLNATVGTIDFEAENNVVLFLFAIVGGVTTVSGALVGGILFALLPLVQSESPTWAGLVFAAVAVAAVLLGKQPNGIVGIFSSALTPWRRPSGTGPPSGAPPPAGFGGDSVPNGRVRASVPAAEEARHASA